VDPSQLEPGVIVRGPDLPEPIEVLIVESFGDMVKIVVGAGKRIGQVHQCVLPHAEVADRPAGRTGEGALRRRSRPLSLETIGAERGGPIAPDAIDSRGQGKGSCPSGRYPTRARYDRQLAFFGDLLQI
jgi:hypothetical protein